ncbi:insulin receptor substrate 2-B isoform X3 [Trichoplusia ni]|uniref:Insulin receptor substrate 1 n=1 Tax=Trichoplusia ni TaxID=7111 RepID=A0A7E5VXW8_TRINI|nr:insulin receptor substrate 2-B isoform X3 [Trichoplusia ni]
MSAAGGGGAGAVVRQGHLRKLKTMKKKYFVLRAETPECSARLEYYESEKKFRAGASPRRVLPLKSCYNIMRRLDLKQKHVIALFTREEQFCIVAENEQELHAWLTAILKQHRTDDASDELLHPIQHVWQVYVQKKGLGATKNIQGLYNLCLTDKTLTLVKIKSHNNVISDLGILERVEYSLKNIRRCGDSERFFYMEVGRQTTTGAGELWMHTDDSNIAQSMHSTIYHAMRNCAKETENERDHIVLPKQADALPARRQTYSDGRGRAGLSEGLCVGACIRQCVCASNSASLDEPAAPPPPASLPAENQNNTLTDKTENTVRVIKHHRTESLPTGYPLFQEPLKISHGRTRSEPLTGDEVDRVLGEKGVTHSSCKAINGMDSSLKKTQWSRRASTGTRLHKLSPAHSKNAGTLRNRCDSMPSRACSSFEVERPPQRYTELEGLDVSRDEADSMVEWYRTPRIPEEPDSCDISRDFMSAVLGSGSLAHSRTSSLGEAGYLPMAPGHEPLAGLVSASSGSLCSGTPSTDPRFSEYQLEPATSHIAAESRPPRAYSVGSRPGTAPAPEPRHRAYSVGARARPPRHPPHHAHRAPTTDHMEIDFSANSPANRVIARTPPTACFVEPRPKTNVDEYVDMSPRNAGYVEMRPGSPLARSPPLAAMTPLASLGGLAPLGHLAPMSAPVPGPAATPEGYVEMNYGRAATRPIAIGAARPPPPLAASPDERRRTPHGSQTLFDMSLDSPASPQDADAADALDDEAPHQPLSTVSEASEEPAAPRAPPAVSVSPQYVTLARPEPCAEELSCNPTATKTMARVADPVDTRAEGAAARVLAGGGAGAARFSVEGGVHYAALDLEPRRAAAAPAMRAYTQIDFLRSEKLHAADAT